MDNKPVLGTCANCNHSRASHHRGDNGVGCLICPCKVFVVRQPLPAPGGTQEFVPNPGWLERQGAAAKENMGKLAEIFPSAPEGEERTAMDLRGALAAARVALHMFTNTPADSDSEQRMVFRMAPGDFLQIREIERAIDVTLRAASHPPAPPQTAKEFYEANATNVCNVPRPGHPEDKSGWDGVRSASLAKFVAADVPVMPLHDVFDFAEKYRLAAPAPGGYAPSFWVIERFEHGKSLGYWTGESSRDFTLDIDQTIQFARREDAIRIRRNWHWKDVEVTEHMYMASPTAPAEGTELGGTIGLDGDTRRCCNDPDCGNDYPCAVHPETLEKKG